ncbi:glycosyltransferase family 69 protein [Phycomyces blakesleeanus]|uniref:Glycosyltransferase family 69 protein n=2 Tax=Phycomyces blakesleeanus TaxID=4837 RepID=A0A162V2P6_PHYB8|nr:glycosyltransferase family 69 protein [Phycomyces blakesleeanus NRRL 1555(-)]OAD79553.1 glycosyltransferase family 69 protein [Phycomyces blakesleeanus NRRL 1555(-)]|eukprot:XP_018297593.1 glycosyltransferase family 69 protein [Phycomyces blakesleeanus NRRL 1555(-)]
MFHSRRLYTRRRLGLIIFFVVFLAYPLYFYSSAPERLNRLNLESPPARKPVVFIAANIYNNEEILDHWITQVNQLIKWLGASNVYLSIYENGSQDRTKSILEKYDQHLNLLQIPHRIVTSTVEKDENARRIVALAGLRNYLLEPLLDQDPKPDKILFLNDIIFKASDAIELLETYDGEYDAMCAMDFFGEFYDTFATREADGGWVGSGNYPYFSHKPSRKLLYEEKPIPVYSCWNGMIALNAKPFLENKISFRAIIPKEPGPPVEASECCLVHTDLRSLNYTRIYINPRIKVSYDTFHYWYAHSIIRLLQPFYRLFNTPTNTQTLEEQFAWNKAVDDAYSQGVRSEDYTCLWPKD